MPSEQPSPSHDDLVGSVVGNKYRVSRLCGRGGMGSVFEAQNIAIGKRVALKFIEPDHAANRDSVQRFLREAQAASAVESNHIVQIFDVGETDDGRPYIVMELLRGENLGQRLQRSPTLPLRDAIHVVAQTLRGLHRAHLAGIVHRDLKPENVFLVETDDDPLFVKIVDFGISKIMRRARGVASDTITQQGVVLGTPFYMSPEQAQALPDLDARTDLWSAGAILFECLTGQRPFPGDTYEQVIISICTRPPPDVRSLAPSVPSALAAVVERAMTRDRTQRFQSALEFVEALRLAVPDVLAAIPSSNTPVAQRTWPSGGVPPLAPDQHPSRTQSSWSAGHPRPAQADASIPEPFVPSSRRRNARLIALGLTSALLAFTATVGWINRGRFLSHAAPVAVVQSDGASGAAASARIVTNAPDAIVYVDTRLSPDRLVRGDPGSTHIVRVEAPGRRTAEKLVRLDPGMSELRIDLPEIDAETSVNSSPVGGAASAPSNGALTASPSVSRTRPPAPPSSARAPADTGTLGGGLKLKTDIP